MWKCISFSTLINFWYRISENKILSLLNIFTFRSFMDKSVFKEIAFLCKWLSAVCKYTLERTLSCVRSQMIKEIMPLSENHFAWLYITLHDPVPSLRPRVLKFKNTEVASLWNKVLFYVNTLEVHWAAMLHLNPYFTRWIVPFACLPDQFWQFTG